MRIAYCDHSYHQKTQSTLFLPTLLAEMGHSVEYFWDSDWENGTPVLFKQLKEYDAIVIFQAIPKGLPECIARHHPNVTFIPMLDQFGIAKGPLFDLRRLWRPFHGSKVLSFSKAVHAIATSNGIASLCCQYMPPHAGSNLVGDRETSREGLHVFFWARRPSEISIEMVSTLLRDQRENLTLHVHLPADPGEVATNEDDVRLAFPDCRSLTISHWFENKEEMMRIMRSSDVYVAPRLEEGIGQSYLEALSAGLCVVSQDNGTMNEYLVDGVNGMVYDPENVTPLDFTDLSRIRTNARLSAEQFRIIWARDKQRILNFILQPSSQFYDIQHAYHGMSTERARVVPLLLRDQLNRITTRLRSRTYR